MKALQIPVTLYIHALTRPLLSQIESPYVIASADMSVVSDAYVLLETRVISLEVIEPEPIDVIGKQITGLRAQKERLAAESHRQQSIIDDKIQQLLCIDHSPIELNELPF
ncbi:hypothetical protein [Serratia fonticola]|uniref:hypothetical protein n=1 Tax=Serratia fonticola TaxID=47917 RepID=UPI002178B10E|nr:hypothetical protein [Serratia fonticola]CAI1590065.1 Uncharacterised protein [Serratia fonticola]CAI1908256.1 Uncharacterised protein [Serratia fonticola]CAI1923409.1 Uncharacterised protein [Serratia fonticola]